MGYDINTFPTEAIKVLEIFPEFEITDFNASGANGYVMIGNHKVLKKLVAIKIYFHEENEVDQEPSIVANINHDNVLKIYDARRLEDGCSFYMMQAANAGDLLNFSKKYHFSTIYSHKLLCQLLSGIAILHSKENSLVHRDLKPDNLLIHNHRMIIADFGSVRRIDIATGKAPASKHSILYRPPEAFGNKAFFDFKSDIYQAGMIGYLLFGGLLSNDLLSYLTPRELKKFKKVEQSDGDYETSVFIDSCLEKRIKSGKLLDWNSLPFYVSEKIKRILKKAVSKHSNRYGNVSEFLSDLVRVKNGMPNWLFSQQGYVLRNFKGTDYLLFNDSGVVILKKKKHSSTTNFRIDNSVKAKDLTTLFRLLKKKLKF